MSYRFFHRRVFRPDHSTWVLPVLASCFLLGIVIGHIFAGFESVCQSRILQNYISSFWLLLQNGQVEAASIGYTFFSYCKYSILVFLIGFTVIGCGIVPAITFYQGFALSFAVSVMMYSSENGFFLAAALFGIRCLFVLPCYFVVAHDSLGYSIYLRNRKLHKQQSSVKKKHTILHFIICVVILFAGAFFEHMFLIKIIYAIIQE